MIYKITITPSAGSAIGVICEAAVEISETYKCQVDFTFNDRHIVQPAPPTKQQKIAALLEAYQNWTADPTP